MNDYTDSDTNVKMLTTKSFDYILEQIQTSSLNYQIQISPFSALISLKKSLIKDKSGRPCLPTHLGKSSEHVKALVEKNEELEKKLSILTKEHSEVIHNSAEAYKTVKTLQNLKQDVKAETASGEHIRELEDELCVLRKALKCRENEILELQIANKNAKEASNKLNEVLAQNRVKFQKEKNLLVKEHRAEVKAIKKDLGNERREKVKLEMKLTNLFDEKEIDQAHQKKKKKKTVKNSTEAELSQHTINNSRTFCSLCSDPVNDYQPEYFCGEKYNPACQTCKSNDSSWFPNDPFSSFPSDCQPVSLVSHKLLPQESLPQNPSSIHSLVSHCVKLPNPGDSLITMEELLELMRDLFEDMRNNLKL